MSGPISEEQLLGLEPSNPEDGRRRAMYLAAQMGRHSVMLIRSCLDYCDTVDFNGRGALKQRPEIPGNAHQQAMKEITTLSLWLMLAEQTEGGTPQWLQDMYLDSLGYTDEFFELEEPTTKELLKLYPYELPLEDHCHTAAMRMCHLLKLGETVNDAVLNFAQTIHRASNARAAILNETLTKPWTDLQKIIDDPPPV